MAGGTYIAVAGNIGVGKSSLTDFLCRTYGIAPFFEPNEENPYLADYYTDAKTWSFHSQLYFLTAKFRIHQDLSHTPGVVVQDRTIFEDAEVFAAAQAADGQMSRRDYETYKTLYETICRVIRPPDLMIYLRSSLKTIQKRIKLRGRPMEQNIPVEYLKLLQTLYETWFNNYTHSEIVVIDTDRLDYMTDLVDRIDVMEKIERHVPVRARHTVGVTR